MLSKFKDKPTVKQSAVIWAYHAYYDYEGVRYLDSFMNIMVAYGFYKLSQFAASSIYTICRRTWRTVVNSDHWRKYRHPEDAIKRTAVLVCFAPSE